MIKILFVCHGNICRSPMAEFVMKDLVEKSGIENICVSSAATSTEALGCRVHYGTRNKLSSLGISTEGKYAVQMRREDYEKYDYIIGMDNMNIANIMRIIGADPDKKVSKLLSFADNDGDIADPWYTGNFDDTYNDVLLGCRCLLEKIKDSFCNLAL